MSSLEKIAVVGQGYVGLPLALAAVDAKFNVIGIDTNSAKIEMIQSGISPIEDIENTDIGNAIRSKMYEVSSELSSEDKVDIFLICVPTPLSENHQPDLGILNSATKNVGKVLKAGALIIIESTIQPGTTRNTIIPILEKESGLKSDQFLVAYSPERIDPMNKEFTIKNTPKLVAGLTPEAATKAKEFYSKFIDRVDICDSLEVAEAAKLLES